MGFTSKFSKRVPLKKALEKDNKDSVPPKNIYYNPSYNNNSNFINDINYLVDNLLLKKNISLSNKKYNYSTGWFLKLNELIKILSIRKFPIKKFVSVFLSIFLVFVAIASASIFTQPSNNELDILSVSLEPKPVYLGDILFINVTVPTSYNISNIKANIGGVESVDLSFENSSFDPFWKAVWVCNDIDIGNFIVKIVAVDNENTTYNKDAAMRVISKDNELNETIDVEFDLLNTTSSQEDFDVKDTSNQTFISDGTNISIVDPGDEQIDVLPGTSFYVERTIDGIHDTEVIFAPLFSDGLTFEKIEIVGDKDDSLANNEYNKIDSFRPQVYTPGRPTSSTETRIESFREKLPSNIKNLDYVAYSQPLRLQSPITVRIWFKAPSWEEIKSGSKSSYGKISYLTFAINGGDDFDFESSTWWNSNWGNRKLITINSSQVDADLTNFPILVNITDIDLRDDAQNDGDDIAFILYSDNSTKLNHEIELFNGSTGEFYAWVNITSLSSSVDTKIWMYYNNSGCSNQQNVNGVWDSNHLMVHHLNETSGTHYDSTSNGNNGTWNDVDGQGSQDATGTINGANDFDGNDDSVSLDNQITFTNGYSLMFWAKRDDVTNGGPLGKEDDDDNYVRFIADTTTLRLQDSNSENKEWFSSFNTDVWYYIAITKQSNLWEAYRNGVSLGTVAGAFDLLINAIGDCYLSSVYNFDGIIDEVRISNTVRNSSWIETTYNTITNSSTFISIESEEYNINTSVDPISPYIITYSPFTITATGISGLDNVTLYYRYSTDNSSWGSNVSWHNESNPDIESPWEWSFNFTNGTGYYEFYSIGNKSGFPDESAPSSADAICFFNESLNTLPEIGLINPLPNGTTDVNRLPICQVWANDSDDDTLTVYWYENTTGSWVLRNTNNSISAETIVSYNFTQFTNYSTTFWWKVAINDSIDNISSWYYFTTEPILTSVDTIDPYNHSTFSLNINSTGNSDLDNVTLYYRWSEDNSSWDIDYQEISIFEGFESGTMNTSLWDAYSSTVYGQNEVNNTNPNTGSYSWLMAVDTQDNYNLNELYTIYDFTGVKNINIDLEDNNFHTTNYSSSSRGYLVSVARLLPPSSAIISDKSGVSVIPSG